MPTKNGLDLNDKVILVTGGTGSFGNKFAEVVLRDWKPRKLIIFSRDEYKQHEMARAFNSDSLRFFVGDVRDIDRLHRAMRGVDIVIHAAAMKQVPACEYNPFEAVKTNIVGAANLIDAAIDAGVKRVLAVSSDKAVNPVNLYGATKLCAEKLFAQGNYYSTAQGTRFACARYGNVVGSRGSVIPLFAEQQRTNGTVTVTDKRMTRFWLTLEQGVGFVLKCLAQMEGGEIFVPKIPSMRIMDLVRVVAPDCKVVFTGIRPGEKIHEVLISEEEARQAVELKDMFVIYSMNDGTQINASKKGTLLPEGFRYTSDKNDSWLTEEQLRAMVQVPEAVEA